MGFIVLLLVVLVVWLLYGRGAWIVYRHKDVGISLPDNSTKESVLEELRKHLTYQFLKEIYYNEDGNIAIVGKYDTYPLIIKENQLFVSPQTWESGAENAGKAVKTLAQIGVLSQRFSKENARRTEETECISAYILKIFNYDAPIDARQKTMRMKKASNHRLIAVAAIVLAVALLLVTVLKNNGVFDGNAKLIQDSYLSEYSTDIAIGEAFENFFSDTEWENYKDGIQEYVDFKGVCLYDDQSATVVITFLINEDTFVIDSITVNGRDLFVIEQVALLEAIYEE